MSEYKKTYNPCDECGYSYSKNNQESEMCKICEFKKYIDLDNRNMLFKSPCALGDTLYTVILGKVEKYVVTGFLMDEDGVWLIDLKYCYNGEIYGRSIESYRLGDTWFFTEEEAKKRMEKI